MTTWYVIIPILFVMAVAVYTDLRYRLIYDWLTLPGIAYFLIAHAVLRPDNWAAHVLGVVVLGGLSLGMAVVSNGQLGGGDIKLFAVVGAALGWQAGLVAMGLAYLLAGIIMLPVWLVYRLSRRVSFEREIPLAPFVAGGTGLLLVMVVYYQTVILGE
ncbi:prepilin peptidase [Brevibacillus gelatini]|uniref:prepilin peptidase n=1 Tax=Brevibacillus gelatini TaxID=1655277 RepID=UPI001FE99F80|nr:A24 family peptidase [Brevibacillus gelatini]